MEILLEEKELQISNIQVLYEKNKICEAYTLMHKTLQEYNLILTDNPTFIAIEEDYQETRKILHEFEDNSD